MKMTVDENKSICRKISKETKFYLEHIIIYFSCDQCDQIFDKGRLTFKTSMGRYIIIAIYAISLKHHEMRKH